MRKDQRKSRARGGPARNGFILLCGWLMLLPFAAPVWAATPTATQQAWQVLNAGLADKSTEKRATAVRVLGLMANNRGAVRLTEKALTDEKPEVRAAAALALGQMRSRASLPKLRRALDDQDTAVVLAAASSLREMGDPSAYTVYYDVLTGQLRGGGGLLAGQTKMLHDPKKMAEFGFEQGIGLVPFVGMGYKSIRALTKDDTSPVRAAAAKALANDPDTSSGKALVDATFDKSWIVRVAALDAVAHRGDPALISKIVPALNDEKDEVRYTAAAAIVRLAGMTKKK